MMRPSDAHTDQARIERGLVVDFFVNLRSTLVVYSIFALPAFVPMVLSSSRLASDFPFNMWMPFAAFVWLIMVLLDQLWSLPGGSTTATDLSFIAVAAFVAAGSAFTVLGIAHRSSPRASMLIALLLGIVNAVMCRCLFDV